VYIEEVPSGPQPIAAASTSVVAVLGTTRKGPVKKPTRVTSWSDFQRTFGNATSRSFTAESVFGFFENGGPAAYIVRVDPSASASWQVHDVAGADSFEVSASSPGTWGNAVTISLSRDSGGGSGSLFRSTLTGAATVTTGTEFRLPLASTAGLRVGDRVAATAPLTGGAEPVFAQGTVSGVTGGAVTADFGAAVVLPAGSVVAGSVAATNSLFLPAGKGFKAGDVIVVTAPSGATTSAVVTAVAESGPGTTLTLAANATAVPGAALVQRRVTLPVVVANPGVPTGTPPSINVTATGLTLPGTTTRPGADDLKAGAKRGSASITFADGRSAQFGTTNFAVVGPIAPEGEAELTYGLFAELYAEGGLSITKGVTDAATDATISSALGWVPEGTIVSLSGTGATTRTATRNAGSASPKFTLSGALDAAVPYTDARVVTDGTNVTRLVVRAPAEPAVGDAIQLGTNFVPLTGVEAKGGDAYIISWATAANAAGFTGLQPLFTIASAQVGTERFAISATADGVTESFSGLSLSITHPRYYAKDGVINGTSALISVAPRDAGAGAIALATMPYYATPDGVGSDATASNEDYRQGLVALEAVDEPALVIAPDSVGVDDPLLQADLVGKVITHCEQFRRFAIVDAPRLGDQDLATWRNTTVNSTYAAVFAPHLSIVTINPDSIDRYTSVPPSGFVAGVFARTDRERGVHKAPGNERVNGIVGLSENYTQRRQDLLNPSGVNLIRAFPGRGTRIWGARNATDDTTWRYLNVRRLFNMIETSVERSTQWVVFEPNTASTWIRIKVSVENFLDQQWRAGALAGTKPEEAYRVRVGLGQTMTETDIDLGLVITEVAIAPAKPAEFVVFRFSHKRLSE